MKHYYKIAILLLVLVMVSADSFANCKQAKSKDPQTPIAKGLRLSVELVGSELLKPGGSIAVKFKLENTGKSPVYISKQLGFGAGGFRVAIVDANNNPVPPNFIRENFPAPVLSKDDLQAIDPGKSIQQQIEIPLEMYNITPGDYSLRVLYISPVAADAVTGGLTVLSSDDDALEAKPITFKVLAP
jgi:hypothetical protein